MPKQRQRQPRLTWKDATSGIWQATRQALLVDIGGTTRFGSRNDAYNFQMNWYRWRGKVAADMKRRDDPLDVMAELMEWLQIKGEVGILWQQLLDIRISLKPPHGPGPVDLEIAVIGFGGRMMPFEDTMGDANPPSLDELRGIKRKEQISYRDFFAGMRNPDIEESKDEME